MPPDWLLLVLAGIGAGLAGSIAGLAGLVSYPALLAYGLPPVAANVTNSTAMLALTTGAVAGSRTELRGQSRRIALLLGQMCVGGAIGAALLLTTPSAVFAAVAPWLIGLGAVLLLCKDPLRRLAARAARTRQQGRGARGAWAGVVLLVGVYAGYFGAGAGVILLAVLALRHHEPLAVTNAVKNVGTGLANGVATAVFVVVAPVDFGASALLGLGALAGAWAGMQVVRVLPERPLQVTISLAGLAMAGWLGLA